VGFAVSAWVVGFISERLRRSIVNDVLSVSVGALAIYGVGIPWLKWMTGYLGRRAYGWEWFLSWLVTF